MWSLQSLMDFFKRRDFDFDNPHMNLHIFHPQLRILLASNGIFFNNIESKLRFVWPFIYNSFSIMAMVLEIIFIEHGISVKDYSFATESFCYFIIITSIPIVNISVLMNKKKLLNLLEHMNRDFVYICGLDMKYKNQFLQGQLLIWQLCNVWFIFTSIVASLFIVTCLLALIYQSLFGRQDENTIRPLPFPVWLPNDDPYRTPIYEIFLIFESIIVYNFIQTFCVYVYVMFHTLLHYYYLMSMTILDFEVIFDGLDETVIQLSRNNIRRIAVQHTLNQRMKRIVTWHISLFRSVKNISSVYGPPLVFQVSLSSVAICLMAYQIAEYLDRGKIHFLFILLLLATCIQLWIPCFLGTLLRNQAFAVGEACWSCGWHEKPLGRLLRSDIIILILRAQQPVNIQFTGLPKLELETFSSILSTSYSYFNILRQYE
ncbi:odorant receptor 13a-like [Battus philenor]|uniref:odorant receptor 13a-like n=1 Tax=Battus philenor TaxID=42288 RepID=UPI0035CFD238